MSTAFIVCYVTIWARSSYTKLVNSQLNNSMRVISGVLQPTQLPWLLAQVATIVPPELRHKAASDVFFVQDMDSY